MNKILSSEIISLVHHVKLNEGGWWEKAVQNIVISIFSVANNPLTEDEIVDKFQKILNSEFEKTRITKQLNILRSNQKIIKNEDKLILSPECKKEFEIALNEQKRIEENVNSQFNALCISLCPDIFNENLWQNLNDHLIIPLVKEIGAKTYELISGDDAMSIKEYRQFNNFISRFEDKAKVHDLLVNFFNFKNEDVKKYIIHQLNGYFFIEATNLNQSTIEQVYALSKTQANLKVFVDTNFLLTLLDLHDNPSNEASLALIEMLDEIKNRVRVSFYALPITIFEFQNLIKKFKDYLKKLKPTLNQAIAGEGSDEFSGIIKKYFQKCHEKGTILDVDDYFDPYLDNFTVNLRKKGIEIQQDNMEEYSKDQRVIDDLNDQVEYRYQRNEDAGKYSRLSDIEKEMKRNLIYDKFNHDCKLWFYVKDKRPTYIDSTKDVNSWILTLDFSFLEYDKYKQYKDSNIKINLCLHPNEFISMLQFWVPRTEKFENAILGNFRLPFLFKEIDTESEKVSIEILRAIAQYEDSDKFTSELVTEILTNKALRQKIKSQNSVEENAALIRDEILKKYEETKLQLDKEAEKNNSLSSELLSVKDELKNLTNKVVSFHEQTTQKIEKELILVKESNYKDALHKHSILQNNEANLKSRINDIDIQIEKVNKEFERQKNKFFHQIKYFTNNREAADNNLLQKIRLEYYDVKKYEELKTELQEITKQLEKFNVPTQDQKIIIYCENQNSKYFNKLGFSNVHFFPENNSNSVYIKTVSNTTHFGLRDRDFLSDKEIERLKKKHTNYMILEYYCFENYLYHPENLMEAIGPDFDIEAYRDELKRQKDLKYDSILINLKNARNGYQEFKLPDNNIREKNDDVICEYLKSDDESIFLKSFSLKTEFDKTYLAKYNLSAEVLSSTEWFKSEMAKILSLN